MFFRRKQPTEPTFADDLGVLRQAGFEILQQPDGRIQVSKHGCGAMVTDGHPPRIERAGWIVDGRIALLVDQGYQKFWDAGDRQIPAQASQLGALHAFEEDLRAALGVESLYNLALGTTNDVHHYDRVAGR
jgi:hypothetical protein